MKQRTNVTSFGTLLRKGEVTAAASSTQSALSADWAPSSSSSTGAPSSTQPDREGPCFLSVKVSTRIRSFLRVGPFLSRRHVRSFFLSLPPTNFFLCLRNETVNQTSYSTPSTALQSSLSPTISFCKLYLRVSLPTCCFILLPVEDILFALVALPSGKNPLRTHAPTRPKWKQIAIARTKVKQLYGLGILVRLSPACSPSTRSCDQANHVDTRPPCASPPSSSRPSLLPPLLMQLAMRSPLTSRVRRT